MKSLSDQLLSNMFQQWGLNETERELVINSINNKTNTMSYGDQLAKKETTGSNGFLLPSIVERMACLNSNQSDIINEIEGKIRRIANRPSEVAKEMPLKTNEPSDFVEAMEVQTDRLNNQNARLDKILKMLHEIV